MNLEISNFLDYLIPLLIIFFGIILILKQVEPNKGCLNNKTEEQKDEFFKSLYEFTKTNLIFYNEQVSDLLEDEIDEFNTWILKTKKLKN